MPRNSPNFASIRSQRRQSPYLIKNYSQRVAPISGHPNDSLPLERGTSYQDEAFNYQKNPKDKNYWKSSQKARFQTPRNKFNATEPIPRSDSGLRGSQDRFVKNHTGKTQDFISRNEVPVMNYQRPAKKYDKFINNRGRGIRTNRPASPRMYKNNGSQKSLHGNGVSKPLQSVKSMQPQMYLNKYEDDCLYMNLEEEYLHRVSKRQGKSTNISINRSMYNFK
jgi:hypothetical protein